MVRRCRPTDVPNDFSCRSSVGSGTTNEQAPPLDSMRLWRGDGNHLDVVELTSRTCGALPRADATKATWFRLMTNSAVGGSLSASDSLVPGLDTHVRT